MTKNFLPRPKTIEVARGRILCRIRGNPVPNKSEERIRQRVLNWLIDVKGWPAENVAVERKHDWITGNSRGQIFSDIELFDSSAESNAKNTAVLIECKAPSVTLTDTVFLQARKYAIKSKAKNIWMTNGSDHWFLTKEGTQWKTVSSLDVLGVSFERKYNLPDYPKNLNERTVDEYLSKRHGLIQTNLPSLPTKRIIMAFHKLLFGMKLLSNDELPFDHFGIQILEDYGPTVMDFGIGRRRYVGWYRKFAVRARDQLETLYLGINFNSKALDKDVRGAQVCVGRLANKRTTHSLQLSLMQTNCTENESEKCWHVAHNNLRGGKNSAHVFEAINELEAEHLIYQWHGKDRIGLGNLYYPEVFCWENSRVLVANLLHYGLIRYNF